MLCVLILKWLITKCCLCLSKVVRALFLINDAREVQGECKTELVRALLNRSLRSQCIFLNALQRYKKYLKLPNILATFLIKKQKYFGYPFRTLRTVIFPPQKLRISLK